MFTPSVIAQNLFAESDQAATLVLVISLISLPIAFVSSILFFFFNVFDYQAQLQTRCDTKRVRSSTPTSPFHKLLHQLGLSQAEKSEPKNLFQVSHAGAGVPSAQIISHCFPRCCRRKLNRKTNSQVLNYRLCVTQAVLVDIYSTVSLCWNCISNTTFFFKIYSTKGHLDIYIIKRSQKIKNIRTALGPV